jgi:hypothetical protein
MSSPPKNENLFFFPIPTEYFFGCVAKRRNERFGSVSFHNHALAAIARTLPLSAAVAVARACRLLWLVFPRSLGTHESRVSLEWMRVRPKVLYALGPSGKIFVWGR